MFINVSFHSIIFRAFEGDPSEITTLYEAEYREQVLQETLQRVQLRKVSFTAATP
jgi:hypothetical protein